MRRAERRSKQKPRRTTPQPRHSAPQARRHAACPRTRVSSPEGRAQDAAPPARDGRRIRDGPGGRSGAANRRPRAHARRRSTTQDNGAPRAPRRCGVVFPDQVAQSARPWQRSAESRRRICAGRARRDGAPLCRRGARRRRSARRQSQATEPWGEPAAAPSQERSAHGDFGGPSPPVCDGCDAADAQHESGYAWRFRRACLPQPGDDNVYLDAFVADLPQRRSLSLPRLPSHGGVSERTQEAGGALRLVYNSPHGVPSARTVEAEAVSRSQSFVSSRSMCPVVPDWNLWFKDVQRANARRVSPKESERSLRGSRPERAQGAGRGRHLGRRGERGQGGPGAASCQPQCVDSSDIDAAVSDASTIPNRKPRESLAANHAA